MLPAGRTPSEHVAPLLSISLRSVANVATLMPVGYSSNRLLIIVYHPRSAHNFPGVSREQSDG